MGTVSMLDGVSEKKPEVIVFAGPNGSGKSTVSRLAKIIGLYINADEIKMATNCSDLEAAQKAESLREDMLSKKENFTFETVLSTDRNLRLLERAKAAGYFVRCIYVFTRDVEINISRVKSRAANGGHSVPEDKIRSRYQRALSLLPRLIQVCDIFHLYDNSTMPFRIFKKRKDEFFFWPNEFWSEEKIKSLVGAK